VVLKELFGDDLVLRQRRPAVPDPVYFTRAISISAATLTSIR